MRCKARVIAIGITAALVSALVLTTRHLYMADRPCTRPRAVGRAQLRARTRAMVAERRGAITCQATNPNATHLFYNRIGKAGSSSLVSYLAMTLPHGSDIIDSLAGRGSDEFLSPQGELELAQKLMGAPEIAWMHPGHRGLLIYHTFFIDFRRLGKAMPIYVNMVRCAPRRAHCCPVVSPCSAQHAEQTAHSTQLSMFIA